MKEYSKVDKLYLELTKDMKCVCCGAPAVVHTLGDFYDEESLENNYVVSEMGDIESHEASNTVISRCLCDECQQNLLESNWGRTITFVDSSGYELSTIVAKLYFVKLALIALSQYNKSTLKENGIVDALTRGVRTSCNGFYIQENSIEPISATVIPERIIVISCRFTEKDHVDLLIPLDLAYDIFSPYRDFKNRILVTSYAGPVFTERGNLTLYSLVNDNIPNLTLNPHGQKLAMDHLQLLYYTVFFG